MENLKLLFNESIKGLETSLTFEKFKDLIKEKYVSDNVLNNVHILMYEYLISEGALTSETAEDFLSQHLLFDQLEEEIEDLYIYFKKGYQSQLDLLEESVNTNLTEFELREIGNLSDFISLNDFEGCYNDFASEDFKEYIYHLLDSCGAFHAEVIYYHNAIEYLMREDPSLHKSLELAEEAGYNLINSNSEVLASLHLSEASRQSFLDTPPDQFQDLKFAIKRYFTFKNSL